MADRGRLSRPVAERRSTGRLTRHGCSRAPPSSERDAAAHLHRVGCAAIEPAEAVKHATTAAAAEAALPGALDAETEPLGTASTSA